MIETNKDLSFNSEVTSYDPETHTIWSFISTTTPDYVGDIVLPEGYQFKRLPNGQPKRPVVLDNHDDKKIVGKNLDIVKKSNGLLAKTQFADTELGREREYLYSKGFMTDFSVRLVFDENGIEKNEHGGYTFKNYTIPEYSTVAIGCNWEAVSKTKSLEEIIVVSQKIKSKEIKDDFEKYIKRKIMEDRIKSLEDVNKIMETDIETLKSLVLNLTSRIESLEINIEETVNDESGNPISNENEKNITVEDFTSLAKKIFSEN